MRRRAVLLALVPTALLTPGCRRRRDPEQEVRRTIAALEAAAERKDSKVIGEALSSNFRGPDEQDRRQALALLRAHLLRNDGVHLLTRISAVEVTSPTEARAEVVAAMAGVPQDPAALDRFEGDVYLFELTFVEEERGVWRLRQAAWSPATVEDLL